MPEALNSVHNVFCLLVYVRIGSLGNCCDTNAHPAAFRLPRVS